jgi:hypothetical protein
MELTFQTFQKPAAYGDQRKLVIQDDEVRATPVTRGWHRIEKQQVNQSLLRAMKAQGLDHDIIRYSIGFETREKNWDRNLEKFEKGGIRLTARAMKIISDRTEICILRNREANKLFISKTNYESFLKENILNWGDLGEERQQGIIHMIPKRLERMGLDGKHKLNREDVVKAIDEEIVQHQHTQTYQTLADEHYLLLLYRSFPLDSRRFPDKQLPLHDLAPLVQHAIQQHYLSGKEVNHRVVREIAESHLKDCVETESAKALLARQKDVTKTNLVKFSQETMGLGNLLVERNLERLMSVIENKIDEKWASAGYLNQDAIDEIYQQGITAFQKDQEQQVAKAQADFMTKERGNLLKNISESVTKMFWNLGTNTLGGSSLGTTLNTRYSDAIREFVASSSPPIHTHIQLRAVVKLATEYLLFTHPDTLKEAKTIKKEGLREEVKTIRKNFSEYNDYSGRPYDAPELDPDMAIRQAQELAEKMAGKKLPDLMEALQEK